MYKVYIVIAICCIFLYLKAKKRDKRLDRGHTLDDHKRPQLRNTGRHSHSKGDF